MIAFISRYNTRAVCVDRVSLATEPEAQATSPTEYIAPEQHQIPSGYLLG
jgi:hypothetical protein